MAVEIPTIRRLFIADKDKARKSVLHTVYTGSGPVQPHVAQHTIMSLQFICGIAQNVPTQDAQRYIDMGHATTERPKSAYELEEERERREEGR